MTIEVQDYAEHSLEVAAAAVEARNGQVVMLSEDKRVDFPGGRPALFATECSAQCPTVENISVNKSKRVHIGPKFVSVTQNVTNNEVVKGRIFGLDLKTSQPSQKCRSSVIVFVCWTSLFASGVCALILNFVLPHQTRLDIGRIFGLDLKTSQPSQKCRSSVIVFVCWTSLFASGVCALILYFVLPHQTRLNLGLDTPWYVRRGDWQALPAYEIDYLSLPVKHVVLGHSAEDHCNKKYECIKKVLSIQQEHLRKGFSDIGPNFLVGGKGFVFEGRGANVLGAMVKLWNTISITIMFLGDYNIEELDAEQIENVKILLEVLVTKGILVEDYTVIGACQVQTQTYSPGKNVMSHMNHFSHWNPQNSSDCLDYHPGDYKVEVSLRQYLVKAVKNSTRAERIACCASVVALLVSVALIVFFVLRGKTLLQNNDDDPAPKDLFITREMWLAQEVNQTSNDEYKPLRLIIINHSASSECHRFAACAAEVRNTQRYYLEKKGFDIPYNFFIGNEERAYEGRGWGVWGAHTILYNVCSLGIGFAGDYREVAMNTHVTKGQVIKMNMLLEYGVRHGYLHPDYVIVGGRDIYPSESPGTNLYQAMATWEHYDNKRYKNMTCKQIYGLEDTAHN